MTSRIDRRDLFWVVLIAVSFIFGLAVSWERWGNPLVDCGREMNQPLRLARGEMLYSDVRHIYGPLSPYLNSLLYEIFGPSLGVLYAGGIVTAVLIVALVYWLARQLMAPPAASAAALSLIWMCAFKQAGNYILPYSYAALHGCALGLISLALLVGYIRNSRDGEREAGGNPLAATAWLLGAGLAAGATILAKTEMGFAAVIAGIVAVGLTTYPSPRRSMAVAGTYLLPAVALVLAVYGAIAARVGWHTLSSESFLFLQNLPRELIFYNKWISGFDHPGESVVRMISAAARMAALGIVIGTVSLIFARRSEPYRASMIEPSKAAADSGKISYLQLWVLLGASLLLFVLIPLFGRLQYDQGPYLGMPVLLAGLLIAALIRYQKQVSLSGKATGEIITLITFAAFALAGLARVILRVRSGGAYSSYLLPGSVILFTYMLNPSAWAHLLGDPFRNEKARRTASNITLCMLFVWVVVTSGVIAYRYRSGYTYPLVTARGTMITVPDLGAAMSEAIDFIERETAPGEPVAIMPEGTSLNFFTGRPHPLREEITTPGFLDKKGEQRVIRRLIESNTRLILITNRPTIEFAANVFGVDYYQDLMRWIGENFEQRAVLGLDHNPNLEIGDRTFFIRAYVRRDK
ncbi:MAG TPA: hypothetical protein VNH22_03080 [Blastocatellia bacterium]|nr:hypothetical protein [Blastocatellia bacterium]